MLKLFSTLMLITALSACSDGGDTGKNNAPDEVNPYAGYFSSLYDGPENWLCRPDIVGEGNVCEGDISSTIVFSDGTTQHEENVSTDDQPVDCFYIYPTVSEDKSDNADLTPRAEIPVTFGQAARYRGVCKVFAPVYRQVTLAALLSEKIDDSDLNAVAYRDVVDAFKYLIANGEGRGFILVSHSQGSTHLIRLIQEEIESNPYLAKRMIAAHLIGQIVALPNDGELGATFTSTPPCTFENEVNCFVNYSSYRVSDPPVEETAFFFGITDDENTRAACTNPVDLGGGQLNLDAYFTLSQLGPYTISSRNRSISTPFVKVPGLLRGECIEEDGKGYLAITVDANPSDPRVDDIGNDFLPGVGFHLIDITLAQGDLVRLAQRQADKWLNP